MYLAKKSLTRLLTSLISASVILSVNFYLPTKSVADYSNPKLYSEADVDRYNKSPILRNLREAMQLFEQGNRQYKNAQYSEAEKSLKMALNLLDAGSLRGFKNPKTRHKGFSVSTITGKKPLDNLYARIMYLFIQGDSHNPSEAVLQVHRDVSDDVLEQLKQPNFILEKLIPNLQNQDYSLDNSSQDDNDVNQISNFRVDTVEDVHSLEVETLQLLQRVFVAQGKDDKFEEEAFKAAQLIRNLELLRIVPFAAYALSDEVYQEGKLYDNTLLPKPTFPDNLSYKDFRRIAQKQKATIVYYSVASQTEVFAWIAQPTGKLHFQQIDFTPYDISLDKLVESGYRAAYSYVDRGNERKESSQPVREIRLRNPEENRDQRVVPESYHQEKLKQLHQRLIEPIEDLLPASPEEHVVFIPQNSMFLVPFPALKDADGRYLIEKHTIRTAPNLHSLLHKRRPLDRFPRGRDILIVGNPADGNVPNLPKAGIEARIIAVRSGSHALIGNEANEKTVLSGISNAKILHFATHGVLDVRPSEPRDVMMVIETGKNSIGVHRIEGVPNSKEISNGVSYSFWFDREKEKTWHIVRTKGSLPGAIKLYDSYLTSQEILNLKLNASLAVLSACNTAQGEFGHSTVLGLPLSLGLAGVPRVAVSLWSVPDQATQILMSEFYAEMRIQAAQGRVIDEPQALRKAMLAVKNNKQYQDPINWAGFTLMDVSQ
ncbi:MULTISPECIES: CHAT domain-containing protein [unclassified Moorena]|uniref:CHAT domain-containing protein n=1 Tax=unclassified Moorena TaxID=2683338 RepID=UPI0014000655|nr:MULTISPECIES: CHAT domain-containing protein [unclassified Moorena]NEO11922.1 CHAT domain-containing protein [Moorena sp. SIO3E8]NEQ03598.1 CHAT domain-containing protein [Moorena sp. SIO3F7]